MEAVIESGGKQYLVGVGSILDVEKIEVEPQKEIVIEKILLIIKDGKVKIGTPYLKNAKVKAQVLEQRKGRKVIHFRYRKREQYKRKKGHRQRLTRLKILEIKG